MYKIKIEKFEGPLDLLLQLIEAEELDISQISLAEISEQYIKHLEQVEKKSPETLADFLVVAAKLLYIKSKILLPALEVEEEEGDLEQQLRIYKEYLEASKKIQQIIANNNFSYFREKTISIEPIFSPPKNLTTDDFSSFFKKVLGRLEPIVKLPERSIRRAVSIKDKIHQIRQMIFSKSQFYFKDLLKDRGDKTEKIVNFLALLELIKQRDIQVDQNKLFADISIKKI